LPTQLNNSDNRPAVYISSVPGLPKFADCSGSLTLPINVVDFLLEGYPEPGELSLDEWQLKILTIEERFAVFMGALSGAGAYTDS
jgi:hypothetical protein